MFSAERLRILGGSYPTLFGNIINILSIYVYIKYLVNIHDLNIYDLKSKHFKYK